MEKFDFQDKIYRDLKQTAYENDPELEHLVQEFAEKLAHQQQRNQLEAENAHTIQPLCGFVIKTKVTKQQDDYLEGTKVFVNICHSPEIPAPPLVSKQEIQNALEKQDNTMYKVPMSLTPVRSDVDKSGGVCIVFDACLNTTPYNQTLQDPDFKLFIIELALSWIEEKTKLELSRQISLPKMKSKGYLVPHVIKRQKRADILPIEEKPEKRKPNYIVTCDPLEDPQYIVIEVDLNPLKTTANATLDIEESRLILNAPPFFLDIELPIPANIDEAGSQFDKATGKLYVTMSVLRTQ